MSSETTQETRAVPYAIPFTKLRGEAVDAAYDTMASKAKAVPGDIIKVTANHSGHVLVQDQLCHVIHKLPNWAMFGSVFVHPIDAPSPHDCVQALMSLDYEIVETGGSVN